MEIVELKNKITKIKTHWVNSITELRRQKEKKSMNWKIKQHKLMNPKNRDKID